MGDKEKGEPDLAVDGPNSETELVDAEIEREQEETPGSMASGEQNANRAGEEDKKPGKNDGEDQNPNDDGTEHQNLSESGQLSENKPHQSEKEELADVRDEPSAVAAVDNDGGPGEAAENKNHGDNTCAVNHHETLTPNSFVRCSNVKPEGNTGERSKKAVNETKMPQTTEEDESGTMEEQAVFMKELENFYKERAMEFKPPRFYGQPLNCLKLWRAVTRLGGYDRVTASKLWRQVGESFHPPKTCTTVSWTFRIFYEKALLEYERHMRQNGELQLPIATIPEPSSVEHEANGCQAPGSSGRARRDAAARAMQGWHVQRLYGFGEVGEPIIKVHLNTKDLPRLSTL